MNENCEYIENENVIKPHMLRQFNMQVKDIITTYYVQGLTKMKH